MASPPPASRIAVIGAGFSGSLLALHLLRRAGPDDRIYLVEKSQHFGRGPAYATGDPNHLLNVRAGNMSAFPDQPDHFVAWMKSMPDAARLAVGEEPNPSTFVPRRVYGDYIQSLLAGGLACEAQCRNLFLVVDEAVAIHRRKDGLTLELAVGRRLDIDRAILSIGSFPPAPSAPGYHGNPWSRRCLDGLDPDAPVLVLGTGLTFVDTAVTLLDRGHRGRIHALSRRGLLPRVHATVGAGPLPAGWAYPSPPSGRRLVALLREVRGAVRSATSSGLDWRAAIDGLRPHTQRLWREMPLDERRRFLRHLRPWWDVHRHRSAPQVMERVRDSIARGQVEIIRGRIGAISRAGGLTEVAIGLHAGSGERRLAVDRVIDCSGPRSDATTVDHPLLRQLLASGAVRPDPLHLGIDVADSGAVVAADGVASDRLFAVGPITKGAFWEIIAVPDLRVVCAELAARLAAMEHRAGTL